MNVPPTITSRHRACVLVVEDDASVRRSIQLLLRSYGLDVRAYASPQQLLDDPTAHSAQCLIADLVMPDVDGIGLRRALGASGWTGRSVLISGHLDDALVEEAKAAGFDLILNKPVPEMHLATKIGELLSGHVKP